MYCIQSCVEELKSTSYEIIVVDNGSTDQTKELFSWIPLEFRNNIKYMEYKDKKSNWQCLNKGFEASVGKYLFVMDAHCILSKNCLIDMLCWIENYKEINGGIHARVKFMFDYFPVPRDRGIMYDRFRYSFVMPKKTDIPYKIPAASTCGMLTKREIFEKLGGWVESLGCWGGGEQFWVWRDCICGYPHFVHPTSYIWHPIKIQHNYTLSKEESIVNYLISAYCLGGEKKLDEMIENEHKCIPNIKTNLIDFRQHIINSCKQTYDKIQSQRIMTLDEFFEKVKSNNY